MTKAQEYVERKRKNVLSQLEKAKSWQKPYDPSPLAEGDIVKTKGKEGYVFFIRQVSLAEIGEELGFPPSTWETMASNISIQPGFSYRIKKNREIEFVSDVYFATGSLYFTADLLDPDHLPPVMKMPPALANNFIAKNMDDPALQFSHKFDWEVAERARPKPVALTAYQAFEDFLDAFNSPAFAEIYDILAERFLRGEIIAADVETLLYYEQYLEWSRKHGGDDIAPFRQEIMSEMKLLDSLNRYQQLFDKSALDPDTNEVNWEAETIWQRGDFRVITLDTPREHELQGEYLGQCIKDVDEYPYHAMAEAGHWVNYSLLNKTGRPVATICAAITGPKELCILENRGSANVSLAPDAADRSGRSEKYAQVINSWLHEWETEHGYAIDRTSENTSYAPAHEQYGLKAFGYESSFHGELMEFEDGPEHWEVFPYEMPMDGRQSTYDLSDLEAYGDAITNSPYYFVASDPEPDYMRERNYYDKPSELEYAKEDLEELITQMTDLLPRDRDLSEVIDTLTTIHVFLIHYEALTRTMHAVHDGAELVYHILEEKMNAEPSAPQTPYEDAFSQQLDLGFEEIDNREWARLLHGLANQILETPLPSLLPGYAATVGDFDMRAFLQSTREKALNRGQERTRPELRPLSGSREIPLFAPNIKGTPGMAKRLRRMTGDNEDYIDYLWRVVDTGLEEADGYLPVEGPESDSPGI